MSNSTISPKDWILLFVLGSIWGSSFILMKIGARSLDSVEMAALRMTFAGIILMPNFVRIYTKIDPSYWKWIIAIALVGSGIPSILFAYASRHIDSNISGVINSLTPIFTMLVASIWFKLTIGKTRLIGILIGFVGVALLFSQKGLDWGTTHIAFFPLIAAILYGININLVKEKLVGLSPNQILTTVFGLLFLVSFPYLIYKGTFTQIDIHEIMYKFWEKSPIEAIQKTRAISAIVILGLIGSTLSSLLFYHLLRSTNSIFASMNTYLIPLMSILWGYIDGEVISILHFFSLGIILTGVYLVSKK